MKCTDEVVVFISLTIVLEMGLLERRLDSLSRQLGGVQSLKNSGWLPVLYLVLLIFLVVAVHRVVGQNYSR